MLLTKVKNRLLANTTGHNQISYGYRRLTVTENTWKITHGIICDRLIAEGSIDDDYKVVAKILENGAFNY
ncbi:MAG: hypothetical protein R3321_05855 [Nitrososphaeraceae archaeon]|nr:hypothetical protein [Nitrososphaeraceae archaeon]